MTTDPRDDKWAAMFRVNIAGETIFFVQADHDGHIGAFLSGRHALDFFEKANRIAIGRGLGWAAGAMLNFAFLQPRVFHYERFDDLRKLLEKEDGFVTCETLHATGVNEKVIRCINQAMAKQIYDKAIEPSV